MSIIEKEKRIDINNNLINHVFIQLRKLRNERAQRFQEKNIFLILIEGKTFIG